MNKIFKLLSFSMLLFVATNATAQDWLQCDFEIPAGETSPASGGWQTWDATSRAIIANPVKDGTNGSDHVFHFINGVQWDVVVNYWIDPKLQTNIYEGIKFKVYIVKAGGNDTGTGSKVSFVAAPVKRKVDGVDVVDHPEVKITTEEEVPKGVWTEVSLNFLDLIPDGKHREIRLTLGNYGSSAYFDDITLVAYKSGVTNQTGITVTAADNATAITTKGGTLQMSATVLPADATDKNIFWSVSDKTIADIDGNTGILTAKADGVVKVIAKSADLQKNATTAPMGELEITVSNQATGIRAVNTLAANVYTDNNTLYIKSPSTISNAVVYDITGAEMANKEFSDTNAQLNISKLSAGIYIVKVQSVDNKTAMVKFSKK